MGFLPGINQNYNAFGPSMNGGVGRPYKPNNERQP